MGNPLKRSIEAAGFARVSSYSRADEKAPDNAEHNSLRRIAPLTHTDHPMPIRGARVGDPKVLAKSLLNTVNNQSDTNYGKDHPC